ncbi:MAG: hypothetical protein GY822_24955 [Deltaproteobacteria bacterium]|nr:hypothetical protein [Deltaproteobacteria bacterium]
MSYDPMNISEDTSESGHLDEHAIAEILLGVKACQATGRLTVADATGENHMFFMQGRPVGVVLSEFLHPLGQLLLELGEIDAKTFLTAQRLITKGGRLPGQVFIELNILDDDKLKDVLFIQAQHKASHFCRFSSRPFQFGRGLSFLAGFNATPLDIHAVVFLAIREQIGPSQRKGFLSQHQEHQVFMDADPDSPLPAPLAAFNFGPPEARFLRRICSDWASIQDLEETGTLPTNEMVVLLLFLEQHGQLQFRETPLVAPVEFNAASLLNPPTSEDVFSTGDSRANLPTDSTIPMSAKTNPHIARQNLTDPNVDGFLPMAQPPGMASPVEGAFTKPEEDVVEPVVAKGKKRRKRRSTPMPSMGTERLVSETRREKTQVSLPSIVIAEE